MTERSMKLQRIIKMLALSVLSCIPALFLMPATVRGAEISGSSDAAITVSFDANGGELDSEELQVAFGSTYGELPELTRENYVFDGWYSHASGGIKITNNTKIIKRTGHTLYAHWRGAEKEMELEPEGGNLSNQTVRVYFGSKYLRQLPVPTRENYRFEGWYTASEGGEKITANTIFTDESPKTLYARWKEKGVKVIFYALNGEVYEKEVFGGKEYGELPEPKKENSLFGGWYKLKDYTNYKAKAITAETTVEETGLVKLFARWYVDKTS